MNFFRIFKGLCLNLVVLRSLVCMVSEETLEIIFKQHCAGLENTDIQQKPFIIMFSGIPGMGKSFIAKQLADVYQAVCIKTDDIRSLISAQSEVLKSSYDLILQQYFAYFLKHYNCPNKRIILDASIDRKYKQLFPYFEKNNINFLVIRLVVTRDLIIERLKDREGQAARWYLNNVDSWFHDYEQFGQDYKNYLLFENTERPDLNLLITQINKSLENA